MASTISEEVQKGLGLFSQGELAQPAAFKALVDITLDVVLQKRAAAAVLEAKAPAPLAGTDRIALKQGHACLAALFLAAAREYADAETVRGALEDQRVPAPLCDYAAERFAARRDEVRAQLLAGVSGTRRPRVVDAEWRLDYYLKSNTLEHVSVPVFFVRLHTVGADGAPGLVDFTCSAEELQDLVNKLRDAAKQTERSATIFS
jgi:polycomb group RING finger protein 4